MAKRTQVSPVETGDEHEAEYDGQNRGDRHARRAEAAGAFGWVLRIHRIPADTMMNADSVPMFTSSNSTLMLMKPPANAVSRPKNQVPLNGVRYFVHVAEELREQAVTAHGVADTGLAVQLYEHHRGHADEGAQVHDHREPVHAGLQNHAGHWGVDVLGELPCRVPRRS